MLLTALLAVCSFGLGRAIADPKPDSSVANTSPDSLRQRGAALDNYIYEASDKPAAELPRETTKEASVTEPTWIRTRTLWIAAGVACLLGIGTAYLLTGP